MWKLIFTSNEYKYLYVNVGVYIYTVYIHKKKNLNNVYVPHVHLDKKQSESIDSGNQMITSTSVETCQSMVCLFMFIPINSHRIHGAGIYILTLGVY